MENNICKYCGATFCRKGGGNFCCNDHYYKWKTNQFSPQPWIYPLENWIVLNFSHRKKKFKFKGHRNFWKIKCKTCGIERVRGEQEVRRDSRCKNCNNVRVVNLV